MTSDWELLEKARSGSKNAWNELINKYHFRLVNVAMLITGSLSSAQDAAQEAFIRLINVREQNHDGSFNAYITRITYNFALKEKARLFRLQSLDNVDVPDDSNPIGDALKNEKDKTLADAIQSLTDDHKDILVLRLYGELSYEEIAAELDVPLGTVKSRIFYAVKTCREELRKRGILE
ncbi:RNA polymerase sigma factor [bacterium]|nr:RNA polymerase sigma factor [bacterium]